MPRTVATSTIGDRPTRPGPLPRILWSTAVVLVVFHRIDVRAWFEGRPTLLL
ncbi:hypothetical protein [Actinophytocola oryzae]|uniref:hypothetical protein n=1 Tax=Actinophytocola oryzae TaxID=502181 RepID=UPI001415040F|nr:hypothetical protein [Actinophytocola oryzae]